MMNNNFINIKVNKKIIGAIFAIASILCIYSIVTIFLDFYKVAHSEVVKNILFIITTIFVFMCTIVMINYGVYRLFTAMCMREDPPSLRSKIIFVCKLALNIILAYGFVSYCAMAFIWAFQYEDTRYIMYGLYTIPFCVLVCIIIAVSIYKYENRGNSYRLLEV